MATQTTGGGSTTSFNNTPQAQDDVYGWTEEQLLASSIYDAATHTITLDVTSNDLGGKAKTLWSIDDGGTNLMSELLKSNTTTNWEKTAEGNWIRVCNGKIEYRIDSGSNSPDSARSIDSLTGDDYIQDSFYYSIRLSNGTLSYAKVTLDIIGQNDAAAIDGTSTESVIEAGGASNGDPGAPTASGTLQVNDVDVGEKHFKSPPESARNGAYGSFAFNELTGEWSYTLDNDRSATQALTAGQVVTETLTVWSADGTASRDIVVTITGSNDAPVVSGAVSGEATEDGTAVTLHARDNATDVDDATILQVVGVPALPAGVSYDPATQAFTLDPTDAAYQHLAAGQSTVVTVTYGVSDGIATTPASVSWTVTGTNDAPVVSGAVSSKATEDGTAVTLDARANATDVDDATTLEVVGVPALPAGVSYDAATQAFTLDPTDAAYQHLAAGQSTVVTVSYGVSDDIATTPASVSWTVTGTNDAPVVSGAVTGKATEDGTAVTLEALANATDVDDATTLQVVGVPALPAGVSYDPATQAFTLDPTHAAYQHLAAGQSTVVTVSYGVSDGIATTPASVSWTVTGTNDAPVVSGAVTGGATEDGTPVTLKALANATDVDDATTLQVVGVPALPAGVSYNAATETFTLDPTDAAYQNLAAGQSTVVTVSYGVSDGLATTPASVSWTVTGSNDVPVVSGAVSGGATEDGTPVTLEALANATDVDDATTLQVVGIPALPAGVSYDPATQAFTLDPTDAAYQHLAAGQSTVVTVSYGVSDGIATTPASVTWTVTGTNDAPVVSGAVSGEATEDGTAVTLDARANATDVDDATTLEVVGVPALPAGVSYDAATQAFTLDPTDAAYQHLAAGQSTVVTVSSGVSDGIATTPASVSWTVTGTNDAPVVSGAVTGGATEDGTPVTLKALANATDVDDATTLQVVGVPALPAGVSYNAATETFTLDPTHAAYQNLAAGQSTVVTVSYGVSDGLATTPASVSWTVTGSNDVPVVSGAVSGGATEDGTAVTLEALANATDVDDATTLQVVGIPALPAGVSYDPATQAFTLDPTHAAYQQLAAGQSTLVTVSYGVSDGIATTPASVSWTVTGTNDAPVVSGAVTGEATEDGTAVTLDARANATDVDDATTLEVVGVPALPAGVSYDAATQAFTLDPTDAAYQHLAAGQSTVVTVSYGVSDGIATTPASVTWTVTGSNDDPTTGAVTLAAIAEDSGARLITQAELLANAADVDGDSLTASDVEIVGGNGALVDNGNGTWTYTPAADDDTAVAFSYTVADGQGGSVAGSASLDITPVNDAPVNTVPGSQTVGSNTATAISGISVADVDSSTVTTTLSVSHGKLTVGTGGGVTVSNNGTSTVTISGTLGQVNATLAALSYLSNANYSGADTLTVATSDGLLSDVETVVITVSAPANAAPVVNDDVIVISSGTSVFLPAAWLLNNDFDADGDTLSIVASSIVGSLPSGWTITPVTAGGAITGYNVSTGNASQAATLSYMVSDGQGHTSVAQLTIQTPSTAANDGRNEIDLGSSSYNYSYIDGKGNNDTLVANLTLTGTQGNDVFVGSDGNDSLDAGAGNNVLTGGAGSDAFIFRKLAGTTNHISDFNSGTSSTTVDTLRFDAGAGVSEFSVGNNDAAFIFRKGGDTTINVAGTEIAVKTDASVTSGAVQSTINSYGNISAGAFFVFHNSDLGHVAVYHDPNPSAAGGAVLVAELDNLTLLGDLAAFNANDFLLV